MADHDTATIDTDTTSTREGDGTTDPDGSGSSGSNSYWRFGAMIATSVLVMYLLKYTNSYELSHVWLSETRAYMALLMGGAMALVMLGFMRSMYDDRRINAAIVVGSLALMAGSLFLVRSQSTVQDTSWMKAMIPHHSIAILTSERAEITDPRVRELADEIIKAQRKEIKEMEWLIADISENGEVSSIDERPVPDFEGELNP